MRFHSGFWQKCRIGFRWFRIATLLAVLVLVCAFVWFNRVGLPEFLKRPLVETLRARGVELEFTRLRLRFVRGLVAENVRLGHVATPDSPTLSLAEVQLRLDHRALLRRRLQIDSLVLREGTLVWPLTSTNSISLDHIQTDLRFQTNDTWSLDHFQADFDGTKLSLTADIAHAPEIRRLTILRRQENGPSIDVGAQLQKVSDFLARIHFEGAPKLNLAVKGDVRDLHSFVVHLKIDAPAVQTPWGGARNAQMAADLTVPDGASGNLGADGGWWTNLQPYRLAWTVQLEQLQTEKLKANQVFCGGFWRTPELAVTNLSAGLGGGQLEAQARLNVATREFTFTNSSCFDVHAVAALLTEQTRGRLAEFSWTQPPQFEARGSLVLPPWTNRQTDWRVDVQPTIRLDSGLVFTNGTAFGAKIDSARAHFVYSNLVWQLTDLVVAQAKTRLEVEGEENDATKAYRGRVRGTLELETLRPFVTDSNAAHDFDQCKLIGQAALDFEARGRLYDYDSLEAAGRLALTNFSIYGQAADDVVSGFQYSNRLVEFFSPRLRRAGGRQMMTADRIRLDLKARRILFVNGFSTADPEAVTRAIGPKIGHLLEPYHFLEPPTMRVNGYVPLQGTNADMSFEIIKGAPFQWLKLKMPYIAGGIYWRGQALILSNVTVAFYGGSGKGSAFFDFRVPHEGADYEFTANLTGMDVHLLAVDLLSSTNHLEGVLNGQLAVTHADTRDWRTWDGFGRADMRDGLLWDIPVFGVLSPLLNGVSPGLGNSRATEATARFAITNGVIYSDSLEIRSTMMRLQYAGTVDLRENLDARVTAQLLRDTWVVGPLVSTALWPVSKLFEYRVTGKLNNPKSEPVYVPKFLLMPLHPVKSFEEMFPGNDFFSSPPPDK